MSVLRDNTIELFGKTIFLSPQKLAATHLDASSVGGFAVRIETCDDESSMEVEEIGDFDGKKHAVEVEADSHQAESNHKGLRDGSGSSGIIDLDLEGSSNEGLKSDGQRGDTTGVVDGKNLKRPDKILPCPRCNSTETKFCYYNNYNVNQPRHFCKKCQRYWTAGGSMRNVPVGSGRRKTRSSSGLFCRQALVNEVAPCSDSNGFLRFGSDAPLRDSMANALNAAENRENYCQMVGNRQTVLSKPNMSSSSLTEKGNESQDVTKNFQGFPLQMPCYPAQPWPIAWNTSMPPPHMGVSGYPVACYSMQNYWTSGVMGSWINPNTISSPSSSPNSPTLGKHSRDGTIMNTTNSDDKVAPSEPKVSRGIWIPKTLRIDDPSQASKSSIWETLGIQNEKSSIKEGSIFTSFPSEDKMGERLGHKHTNPAALSRSQNFHEATPMKHTSN